MVCLPDPVIKLSPPGQQSELLGTKVEAVTSAAPAVTNFGFTATE